MEAPQEKPEEDNNEDRKDRGQDFEVEGQ